MRDLARISGCPRAGWVTVAVPDAVNAGAELAVEVRVEDYGRWQAGAKVQDAFPYLERAEREILVTGISPKDWAAMFDGDEEG